MVSKVERFFVFSTKNRWKNAIFAPKIHKKQTYQSIINHLFTKMKRFIFSLLLMTTALGTWAQVNLQMHYDLGRKTNPDTENDRPNFTATIEQFRPDRLGNIFYFIDLDLYSHGMKGAYIEFSREFNLGQKGLAIHGEYNGGLTSGRQEIWCSQFQHALLAGPAYNGHSNDFRRTWSVQALFKQYFHGNGNSSAFPGWQLTGVWSLTFAPRDMFTFSGYIDFWRSRKSAGKYHVTMMSEPQLWYNLDSMRRGGKTHLSIGTEWEVSNNFIYPTCDTDRTFFWNPTLAVKWTMK